MGKNKNPSKLESQDNRNANYTHELILTEAQVIQPSEAHSKTGGVLITGLALPFGIPSLNGIEYSKESILATHKLLEKKVMLFNHDMDNPVGHVESAYIKEGVGLMYTADIHPHIQLKGGVTLVDMIKRGDINSVSISIMPNKKTVEEIGEDHIRVDVTNWVELSIVTTPGFQETSINVLERLREMAHGKKITKEDITNENGSKDLSHETVEVENMTEQNKTDEQSATPNPEEKGSEDKALSERIESIEKLLIAFAEAKDNPPETDDDDPDDTSGDKKGKGKEKKKEQDDDDEDDEYPDKDKELLVKIEHRLNTVENILMELSPIFEKLKEDFVPEKEEAVKEIEVEKEQSFKSTNAAGPKKTKEEKQTEILRNIVTAQQNDFLKGGK